MLRPASAEPPRSGFTMIELLIVIVIISVLMGLLLPALNMIKSRQRRVATLSTMKQVSMAVTNYFTTYPALGDDMANDSKDFAENPMQFLYRNPTQAGKPEYFSLPPSKMAIGGPITPFPGGPYAAPASSASGEHILDSYATPSLANRLLWMMVNGPNPGGGGTKTYADRVFMRSCAGTLNFPTDDIILRLDVGKGVWELVTWADVTAEMSTLVTPPPWW
jgi:prepilin-type N-terminal cleavage/methylation domain-containing protein